MDHNNGFYLSRSWALLTRDKGWWRPLLVLGAVMLVPILGPIAVAGYAVEWARLTAWGVDSAPKQRNVRVGECLKSGLRAFVVSTCYTLVVRLAFFGMTVLLGDLGGIVSLIESLIIFAAGIVALVAALRATIYQDYAAGFSFERVWELVRSDADGLGWVAVAQLVTSVLVGIVSGAFFAFALVPAMGSLAVGLIGFEGSDLQQLDYTSMRFISKELFSALVAAAPGLGMAFYVLGVGMTLSSLISYTAAALWLRQFDVSRWGSKDDPLPAPLLGLPAASYTAGGYGAYTQAGYGQDTYQQGYGQDPYAQGGYDPSSGYVQQGYDPSGYGYEPQEQPFAPQDPSQPYPYAQPIPKYGQPSMPYGQDVPSYGQGDDAPEPADGGESDTPEEW